MRLAYWQIMASTLAFAAFGFGYGTLAIMALFLADVVVECIE